MTVSADERRERVRSLRAEGLSQRAIAAELGVSRAQVVKDLAGVSGGGVRPVVDTPTTTADVDALLALPGAVALFGEVLSEKLTRATVEGVVDAVVAKASGGEMAAARVLNHLIALVEKSTESGSESGGPLDLAVWARVDWTREEIASLSSEDLDILCAVWELEDEAENGPRPSRRDIIEAAKQLGVRPPSDEEKMRRHLENCATPSPLWNPAPPSRRPRQLKRRSEQAA